VKKMIFIWHSVITLPVFLCMAISSGQSQALERQESKINTPKTDQPSVCVALGAGGANGLAHILMLEVMDELGVKPQRIAGSSIGAIIGALYAGGLSGRQIRNLVENFIVSPEETLVDEILDKDALRWIDFIEIELGKGGLLSSQDFISFLYDTLQKDTFKQLDIPLQVVAADLWNRKQVVLSSGPLLPAVKASMALPGVFQPVTIDNRVLIDGGTVNPVPYDLFTDECEIVVGIDVSGKRTRPKQLTPGYFETVFNTAKVMQQAVMNEKLKQKRPEIYIDTNIVDIRALEFYRAEEVFKQAQPARQSLKQQLNLLLNDS
jgi:NTE family protein